MSDKIQLLDNMLQVVDEMVIGGAMAYTFLKASGKVCHYASKATASGDLLLCSAVRECARGSFMVGSAT